jgi:hypothetical protein
MTDLHCAGRAPLDRQGLMDRLKHAMGGPAGGTALSPAYVMELRRLIREDAYGSVEVVDEIARRILRARDL